MRALQGLRLNCWLAAVVPSLVGAACVLALGAWIEEQHRDLHGDGLQQALLAHAAHGHADPRKLVEGAGRWSGAALATIDAEGQVELQHAHGELHLRQDDPPPELIMAVISPQSWATGNNLVGSAVPLADEEGSFEFLFYAETAAPVLGHRTWVSLLASLLMVVGALLAWYLSRRIYAPVEDLAYQAEAALAGRRMPLRSRSAETGTLATAVSNLAEAYVERQKSSAVPVATGEAATAQAPAPSPAAEGPATPPAGEPASAESPAESPSDSPANPRDPADRP